MAQSFLKPIQNRLQQIRSLRTCQQLAGGPGEQGPPGSSLLEPIPFPQWPRSRKAGKQQDCGGAQPQNLRTRERKLSLTPSAAQLPWRSF